MTKINRSSPLRSYGGLNDTKLCITKNNEDSLKEQNSYEFFFA
jgi:hypothetical protein